MLIPVTLFGGAADFQLLISPGGTVSAKPPPRRRSAAVFALSLLLVLGPPAVVVLFLIRKSAAFFAFRPKLDIGNPVVIQDASQPKRSNTGVESNYYFVRQYVTNFGLGFGHSKTSYSNASPSGSFSSSHVSAASTFANTLRCSASPTCLLVFT